MSNKLFILVVENPSEKESDFFFFNKKNPRLKIEKINEDSIRNKIAFFQVHSNNTEIFKSIENSIKNFNWQKGITCTDMLASLAVMNTEVFIPSGGKFSLVFVPEDPDPEMVKEFVLEQQYITDHKL